MTELEYDSVWSSDGSSYDNLFVFLRAMVFQCPPKRKDKRICFASHGKTDSVGILAKG